MTSEYCLIFTTYKNDMVNRRLSAQGQQKVVLSYFVKL
jgi:hypothetical protein